MKLRGFITLLCLVFSQPSQAKLVSDIHITVYAAASLTEVLTDLGHDFQASTGYQVDFSFASSGILARQIEIGAPADVYISADTQWMDYLQSRDLLITHSRTNLIGNRLVLIAPANSPIQLSIQANCPLFNALNNGRLAIADPNSVPAGMYAKTALTHLNLWKTVAQHIVSGDSVRTALNFVARGEAPLGIVYASDALIDKRVRIVDYFPTDSYPTIVYPAALTNGAKQPASLFMKFLSRPASIELFKRYGFSAL